MGSKGYGKIGVTLAIGPQLEKQEQDRLVTSLIIRLPTPLATMGSYSTQLPDCLKMNKSTRSHTFAQLAKPLILPIHLGPIRPSPLRQRLGMVPIHHKVQETLRRIRHNGPLTKVLAGCDFW
jgi:hypothetical protein